ncbi:MAG: alpha-xylosidase [Oscillospiraceae bacterium]|nr:alpha-xylosidase [Oscillospiraceae bacterium]
MKFADGYWLNQVGYSVNYACEAYEVDEIPNGVRILATNAKIWNRGQTLGGPTLELEITSTMENVFKVSVVHYKGTLDDSPKFDLNEDTGFKPTVENGEKRATIVSGNTKVVINKENWGIEYYYGDKHLTGGSYRALSYITEQNSHAEKRLATHIDDTFWAYPADAHTSYIREQLALDVGEYVYGFGEKFTPFVKNGQSVQVWNADGGTCCDQSYKSIPFYVSSNGYGVFVNSSDNVSFEVASDTVSKVSITLPGESLEYFVIGGENLEEVLSNYTTLTGKPALPPAYTFGLWLTTSFTTQYDEATITSFIDGMAERDIPLSVFHFDCFWMKEYEWCNFEWDLKQFPDPPAMLKRLHDDKGLKTCVWINPYISQRSKLFDEGVENDYFILNPDGSVFQCDMWQPGMAIVDFTNPAACEWYASKLRTLCEMGVDCFKTDFGERIPTECVYYNGADPIKMHNYYTYLYNQTVFNVLKDYYGENKACLFARSATAGSQKFPVHWGGDCSAEYSSMAETLRGGLSLSLSGFGFFSHDISGFESTATPDIYKRWCAFGLLSTHSRLHGNSSYRVPWLFDDEACDVLGFFTKLKGKLMPYIFSQAVKTHIKGVPMMRAMVMSYPDDPTCKTIDTQYMLGDNLLCAPIMNDRSDALWYLPAGKWTDVITGEVYEGEKWHREKMNYFRMPVLAKPNSIIVWGDFKRDFEYDYMSNSEVVIYELDDGKTASAVVYDKEAVRITEITATRSGNTVTVSYNKCDCDFTVKLSNTDKAVSCPAGSTSVEIDL